RHLFGHDEPLPTEILFAGDDAALSVARRLAHAAGIGAPSRDRVLLATGGVRQWLDIQVSPAADGASVWSFTDATAAQEMAEAIHDEQERLSDFIDNAPVGFYSVDRHGRFIFANSTFA